MVLGESQFTGAQDEIPIPDHLVRSYLPTKNIVPQHRGVGALSKRINSVTRDLARQNRDVGLHGQDGRRQGLERRRTDQKKRGMSQASFLNHIPSGSGQLP